MEYKRIKNIQKRIILTTAIILVTVLTVSCKLLPNNNNTYSTVTSCKTDVKTTEFVDNIDKETTEPVSDIEKFEFVKSEWDEIILEEGTEYNLYDKNILWGVKLENDKIMVSAAHKIYWYGDVRFDVEDGYFFGEMVDNVTLEGEEYIGKLDFIGNDGTSYTVVECNPRYMFSIGDDIYLLEGRWVLYPSGHLYKLGKIDGKWTVEKAIDLEGYAYGCVMVDDKDIYIMVTPHDETSSMLTAKIVKFSTKDDEMEMQKLLRTTTLYKASSIAIKDNVLYLGMVDSIATVDLNNNSEIKFYVKK